MARRKRSHAKIIQTDSSVNNKPKTNWGSLVWQKLPAILFFLLLIFFLLIFTVVILIAFNVDIPILHLHERIKPHNWINPKLKEINAVRKQMAAYFVNTLPELGGQAGKIVWFVTPARSLELRKQWEKTGWPPRNTYKPSEDQVKRIYAEIDEVIKSSSVIVEGNWARWIPDETAPPQYQFTFRGYPGLVLYKIDQTWYIFGGSEAEVKTYGNPPMKVVPLTLNQPKK